MSNLYTIVGVFASIILITNLHNRVRILFEVAFVCESWAAKGYKPSKQRAKHKCSKGGVNSVRSTSGVPQREISI